MYRMTKRTIFGMAGLRRCWLSFAPAEPWRRRIALRATATRDCRMRPGTASRGRQDVWREHSRQPEMQRLPRRHQGVSAPGARWRRSSARPAMPIRRRDSRAAFTPIQEHPCTSCHGDAHTIFPKDDTRSAVYPLNVPKTCGDVPRKQMAWRRSTGWPRVFPRTSIRFTDSR